MTADNAASVFVDQPLDEGARDRLAFATPAGDHTYEALQALTDQAGHGLRARRVEPAQRVALLLPDGVGFAATFFGALKIGAVAVPLNTRLAARDLGPILQDCGAKLLVTDPELLRPLHPELTTLGVDAVVSFEELVRGAATGPLKPEPVGPDAMAFWLYTSGTTGLPKAAIHAHRTLLACRHYGAEVLGVSAADRIFATSKLFFAYALGNAVLIPLMARASAYLCPAWPDPASVLGILREYRPTLFFSVPTFYARLLHAALPSDAFASVRQCVSAEERLPAEIYDGWRRRFAVEILEGMGATETVFMVLSNRPGASRAGSSGAPVPGTEARLLDARSAQVPDGEQGVLWVRTPSVAMGYWNHLDHTRRTFVGEWFRTGDVYRRDADGFFYHCGREDDFFKVAGQWVAPADVEAVLGAHPGVLEAGVIGVEEAHGLVKPFAFVVPRDPGADHGALRAELRRLVESALLPHQRPRDILIVSELPRTATGKLQRFRLRDQVAGRTVQGH